MDIKNKTENMYIGNKRKADIPFEHPSKKQKLIKGSSDEIIPQAIPEIPIESWEHIISFTSCNLPVAMFVSKHWRQTYCRQLNKQISLDLHLPISKAASLPKEVKRIYSKIDIYILLEQALHASKTQDFDLLLDLSSRLQKILNMIVCLTESQKDLEVHAKLRKIHRKYYKSVVYTEAVTEVGRLNDGSDGAIVNFDESMSFFWFGPYGHYIHAKCHVTQGFDHDEQTSWRELKYELSLKDLDSPTAQNLVVEEATDDWDDVQPWTDETVQQITNWLGIEGVGTVEFAVLFPKDIPNNASYSTNEYNRRYMKVNDEREWSGNIPEELERIFRLFLNNENGWAKESEFVMNRFKVKLILRNRIKEYNFSRKSARNEFLALIEHAKMRLVFFNNIEFQTPTSGWVHETTEHFMFSFVKPGKEFPDEIDNDNTIELNEQSSPDGDCVELLEEKIRKKPIATLTCLNETDDSNADLELPKIDMQRYNSTLQDRLSKFIELMELKYVTAADVEVVLTKLIET